MEFEAAPSDGTKPTLTDVKPDVGTSNAAALQAQVAVERAEATPSTEQTSLTTAANGAADRQEVGEATVKQEVGGVTIKQEVGGMTDNLGVGGGTVKQEVGGATEEKCEWSRERFDLLHDVALLHTAALKRQRLDKARILRDVGAHRRALCARKDLHIRRQLCGVQEVSTHTV